MSVVMKRAKHVSFRSTGTIASALLVVILVMGMGCVVAEWVDPDTAEAFFTTKALSDGDEREYELVFSDEFEQEGRTFNDGNDPRWTAINKNDYTNDALHYYSHDNVKTTNGNLNITTQFKENLFKAFDEDTKKAYAEKKYIQSGMIQGWNKFCITGGIVEFSAKLPGRHYVGGFWPALWLLGNLARASYVGSSDFMWPYSYNTCTERNRNRQVVSACTKVEHYDLHSNEGRGAPEIDILEVMPGEAGTLPHSTIEHPYFSTSLQISPGVEKNRPNTGQRPHNGTWYKDLEYGTVHNSDLNIFFYGVLLHHLTKKTAYQSDAISANTQIGKTHFDKMHRYRVEWDPPEDDGTGGYVRWFMDDAFIFGIQAKSLGISGTEIPSEPMYLLMNTAVSKTWGFPLPCPAGCKCECYECGNRECECALPNGYCDNFPGYFLIDYVRVWQAKNESKHVLGCSTEKRPTEKYIKGHADLFKEEGQKHPLIPIQRGGRECSKDSECAGPNNGVCTTDHHRCKCNDGFTGPNCLAHAAFYDDEYKIPTPELHFTKFVLPPSLLVIIVILAIGFTLAMAYARMAKTRDHTIYEMLPSTKSSNQHEKHANGISSYQNSASADYAIPPKQKTGKGPMSETTQVQLK